MKILTLIGLQLLLGLLYTSEAVIIPEVRSYNGEWNEKNSPVSLFMRESQGRHNYLVHGNCERLSPSNKNCTIIYEHFKTASNETERKECSSGLMHNDVINMLAADRNRVILSYVDRSMESSGNYYYNFRVIDMQTCKHHRGLIHVNEENIGGRPRVYLASLLDTSVVLHEDGAFDVFLPPYESACMNSARCKYSFDAEGKQIGKPTGLLEHYMVKGWINMLKTKSHENFFVIVNKHILHDFPRHMKVMHMKTDGQTKDLVTINQQEVRTFSLDFGYGYFSICWKNNSDTFACKQYDSDANAIVDFNTSLPTFIDMKTKNLPNGGLLFVTRESEKDNYILGSILPNGQLNYKTNIDNFECPAGSMTWESANISVDDDKSICLTLVCTKGGFSGQWNENDAYNRTMSYLRNCYSGKELLS